MANGTTAGCGGRYGAWQPFHRGTRHAQKNTPAAKLIAIELQQDKLAVAPGKPKPNALKFFSSIELITLLANREWLDEATKTIRQYWRRKNARRQGLTNEKQADDSLAKDSVVS